MSDLDTLHEESTTAAKRYAYVCAKEFTEKVFGPGVARIELDTDSEYNDEGGTYRYVNNVAAYDENGNEITLSVHTTYWRNLLSEDAVDLDDEDEVERWFDYNSYDYISDLASEYNLGSASELLGHRIDLTKPVDATERYRLLSDEELMSLGLELQKYNNFQAFRDHATRLYKGVRYITATYSQEYNDEGYDDRVRLELFDTNKQEISIYEDFDIENTFWQEQKRLFDDSKHYWMRDREFNVYDAQSIAYDLERQLPLIHVDDLDDEVIVQYDLENPPVKPEVYVKV